MVLIDVNVLVYAYREAAPQHRSYLRWLEGCVNADEPFGLAGAATIIAALAAKARGTGALFGALGLPLLVVFISLLMNAATTVYAPNPELARVLKDVGGLLSYGVALIAVSAVTFRFVWEE